MRNYAGRRRIRFFFPLFILMALFAFSFVVYWLWNRVLVAVVPVKAVTYWQAMGLLILSRILLGGFKAGPPGNRSFDGGGPAWREKWRQMSDEDRAKFKNEWRRRGEDRS
ncbi:hypothetical protein GO755_21710 [Spirosoma sp. HMF4905]|uniref:Uncharacterized protein n=1 Tax=Spirosoma arboris TaxID=2682092 RepID=A0A7K1SFZ7_9BACT|nr:hypothetical protein [Spirosoma arboris]MVM32673.1 hypothetical protein [Spirosoma arboris]